MNRLYTTNWVEQPKEIREHLMKVFGIVRTGISEVRDMVLISDGVTNTDLLNVTSEKMAEYVGSVESFSRLWELSVAKARYELNPPPIEIGGEFRQLQTQKQTVELNAQNPIKEYKFCDSCDSKGGRHLKVCPKFK